MSMSKKDYQTIARALHETPKVGAPGSERVYWSDVLGQIADVMAADNPRFDRARFVEACETGRCKGMAR